MLPYILLPWLQGGEICLHAAAQKGHVAVIKALLQKGAPIDARTKVRQTNDTEDQQ